MLPQSSEETNEGTCGLELWNAHGRRQPKGCDWGLVFQVRPWADTRGPETTLWLSSPLPQLPRLPQPDPSKLFHVDFPASVFFMYQEGFPYRCYFCPNPDLASPPPPSPSHALTTPKSS